MQGKGHGHVSPDITGPRTILWLLYKVPQEGTLFLLPPAPSRGKENTLCPLSLAHMTKLNQENISITI